MATGHIPRLTLQSYCNLQHRNHRSTAGYQTTGLPLSTGALKSMPTWQHPNKKHTKNSITKRCYRKWKFSDVVFQRLCLAAIFGDLLHSCYFTNTH